MPHPPLRRCGFHIQPACLVFDKARKTAQGLGNVRDSPIEDPTQRRYRHRKQDKVAPLTDIEAPRPGLKGFLILHEPREVFAAAAVYPVVFDGLTLPKRLANIQKAEPIRSEQPFV